MAQTASLSPSSRAVRGESIFFIFKAESLKVEASKLSLRIEYSDKSVSPLYKAVALKQKPKGGSFIEDTTLPVSNTNSTAFIFLATVPVRAAPGNAVAKVISADGIELAYCNFEIENRNFTREDLHLDAQLTSIRVDPDPVKTEQAERYQKLLYTVNPEAAYLDSGFMLPLESKRITTEFGLSRRYIYSNGRTDISDHSGIDYGSPIGSPVYAAGRGRVVMAENRIVTGKTVILEHFPGTYTIYMHLSDILVQEGKILEKGDRLGSVGMTGLATGPHLHWELRIMGEASDPEAMINKWPNF